MIHLNPLTILNSTYSNSIMEPIPTNPITGELEIWTCEICNHRFVNRERFVQAHLSKHANSLEICSHCGKFIKKELIAQHIREHSMNRRNYHWSIEICKNKLNRVESFRNPNLIYISNDESHKCSTCDQTFDSLSNLATHENTCQGNYRNYTLKSFFQ